MTSFSNIKQMTDWNIMSNSAMTTFASQVPTSMEELSALGILGENVVKEYGERLVKNIRAYVNQENLQHYLDNRVSKRARLSNDVNTTEDSKNDPVVVEVDEFATDIDFKSIEMPRPENERVVSENKKTSSYF